MGIPFNEPVDLPKVDSTAELTAANSHPEGRIAWVSDVDKIYASNGSAWAEPAAQSGQLPSYTVATLPAAGTAGRLVRVTDGIRGVWIDTGTQWHSVTGYADVKDFGAVGDGTTDDTTALQTAINVGASVFLPPGTYKITNFLTLVTNSELFGVGSASVLKPVYASAKNRIIENDWTNGNTNITLRNFRIDRTGANVQHGVLLNGVTRLRLVGLEFTGISSVTSGALAISGVGAATDLLSQDILIQECRFENTDNFGIQLGYVRNASVVGNVFKDCYREVIGVEPEGAGSTAENVSIVGNSITTGTIPVGGSATGVIIVTTNSGGQIHGVTVTGNSILNTTPTAANANPGISVIGANLSGAVVSGNTVRKTNGPGIGIGQSGVTTDGVVVVGNHIIDCNQGSNATPNGSAIRLRQATHCNVSDNSISGALHTHAVEETSGAANNVIYDNVVRSTVLTFGTAGTGSVYAGNKTTDSDAAWQALGSVALSEWLEGTEIADPAAPAANKGRAYFRDNGSGKTQFVVRFPTGAVQVVATEP